MERLLRQKTYITSFLISLFFFGYYLITNPSTYTFSVKLTEAYAYCAVIALYGALLLVPLDSVSSSRTIHSLKKRFLTPLSVSACYFALLHMTVSFFGELGGLHGLLFLDSKYLLAISLSITAFFILLYGTIRMFDVAMKKLRLERFPYWYPLMYIATVLILIHLLMLGTQYEVLTTTVPAITGVALAVLLLLEGIRFDRYLLKKERTAPPVGLGLTIAVAVIVTAYFYVFGTGSSGGAPASLGIHAQLIAIAQQAQNGNLYGGQSLPSGLTSIPGLNGDRTKRYTMSFYPPDTVEPNQPVTLSFKVYDANSGNQVFLFNTIYDKLVHMIVVNQSLTFFEHIHPTQTDTDFEITTTFPQNGIYHIYQDFQPFGGIEQQFGFTLPVGDTSNLPKPNFKDDTNKTKTFGDYTASVSYPKPLSAAAMSIGQQSITFTLKDAKTGKPVTDLEPYLAAFGHLTLVNTKTYDYIHVHPNNLTAPPPNAKSGPTVTFLPLGLYGPIKPGLYRMFAEFNPRGNLQTMDFTINIGK